MNYSGLFSCCSDMSVCLCGTFCPVYLNTETTYKLITHKRLSCCGHCFVPPVIEPFLARKIINRSYDIENSDCHDCLITTFCYPCTIIQNENNYHNLEKQKYQA